MQGVILRSINALRKASLSYPLSPNNCVPCGKYANKAAAPLWSLCCPSLSKSRTGRPLASQTPWSFVFNPPWVPPYQARRCPPFLRLDAVRCAFKWVGSIMRVSVLSDDDNSVNIRSKTPIRDQRINRL